MTTKEPLNLTMLCDFYELTMGNGYWSKGFQDQITYFDVFFRDVPDKGGFAIAAGLEQVADYIQNLHFSEADLDYLRSRKLFSEGFLDYLRNFRFTGDIYAVPEGTPIFPREPILTVRAPAIQAQLIETYLLLAINHQSLIATKANRVVRAAQGRSVLEFGSRRAQGADGAVLGARAAYIGGCAGTACTISDQLYGVHAGGTMAHSWVQMFDTQYEAFKTYCEIYPDNPVLLVDTYNTLKKGIPDAIRAFNEVLKPRGLTKCGIRLDSGDMTYLTKMARKMLDEAGWQSCKISVSNSLDEYIIQDLLLQGAQIDMFGVGERLITAKSEPVFGGVYKLAAVEKDGQVIPKIKISENVGKITNPHFKKLYRFYGNDTGKAIADYLAVYDETVDDSQDIEIFDPEATWKRKRVYNYTARELQQPIFKNGQLVYRLPSLQEIQDYCKKEVDALWDEVKRFDNPHTYYVDLSQKLWDIKYRLLRENNQA
ncbi:MAG TPA: nicotinate phosphoribosyltransferase [Candidatus Avoscillospira stercorigallinarum]|uniref:Nicotinate phosphoribosyltransferase n=1 Tax=Candidatus Avoscillospira stercorigallinarum TaxID=2840708 RepID=A0A9D0Z520_9FIRM|nr:nicotinate phosphoribosyltransferase [Candidatus Avoscillospira stercorigallinarum]